MLTGHDEHEHLTPDAKGTLYGDIARKLRSMKGKFRRALRERAEVIQRVYWRMSFKIMTSVYGLVGAFTLGIGEFGTDSVQHELLFRILIYRIPLWVWPSVALAIVFISGVEGTVQENRRQLHQYNAAIALQKGKEDAQSARVRLEIEEGRRYEEMRPILEARLAPWTGRNFGKSHRLEVRIKSPRPLCTILAKFPSDPRTGYLGQWIEAPKHGNEPFRPGKWVYVGDVSYVDVPDCDDDLVITIDCRNETWECWDDNPVTVKLPKPVPTPL